MPSFIFWRDNNIVIIFVVTLYLLKTKGFQYRCSNEAYRISADPEKLAHPINMGGKKSIYCIKVISLSHESSRTISIGRVNPAVRDTFKF